MSKQKFLDALWFACDPSITGMKRRWSFIKNEMLNAKFLLAFACGSISTQLIQFYGLALPLK